MPQQRVDLSDTPDQKLTTNKMSRRSFLHTTFGAGLAGSALPTIFLEGCSSTSSEKIELQWVSSGDANTTFDFLVEIFNATNQDNIHVTQIPGDIFNVNQKFGQYRYFTTQLAEKKPQPDIMSLDVIWMKEFATRGWIQSLDQYWHDTGNYLQTPLKAVQFNIAQGQPKYIWGAPHHTDAGILYYRTDMPDIIYLDPAKPWTWDDIKRMCKEAKASGRPGIFAWQGDNFEGLVCNFVEVLSGYGGQIFDDPVQPTQVRINSPEAIEALQQMINWIDVDKISSSSVLSDEEENSTNLWIQGNAAFMRNWPVFITASSNANNKAIAEKFQIAALPSHSQSCLGGWNLTINNFSPHKDEAWKFIHWMLQEDAQQYLALKESLPVTLKSVYANKYVQEQIPFYSSLKDIIEGAQFRPMSPHYQTCISGAIQQCIHQALANPSCYKPEMALEDLERELNRILQLKPSEDCPSPTNIITGCPIVQ